MDPKDYAELFMLVKGAEQALLSGQLADWQHANTSTFHVLATMILDLNDRLARFETTANQLMDAETLKSNTPPRSRIITNGS